MPEADPHPQRRKRRRRSAPSGGPRTGSPIDPAIRESLRAAIARAFGPDRSRLRKSMRKLEQDAKRGQDPRAGLADLARAVKRSAEVILERSNASPEVRYDLDLPVVARKQEIASTIRDHQVVVICGETGSGKSTQLPKICLELGRGAAGFIGHTQPRRLAARSIASRLADELRVPLGRQVGSKVRFNDDTSDETRIKVMTDGILLAETRSDRLLDSYDTLIIDEAHERSLNIDFLAGYLCRILPRRPDLKVVITSATIDPDRFANHFEAALGQPIPIIEVSGRTYPVSVLYRDQSLAADQTATDNRWDRDETAGIKDAIDELLYTDLPGRGGDILVFLPGEREIHQTHKALRDYEDRLDVLPLYARLSIRDQQRVFERKPSSRQRVVLATNVAETSLTVPGITCVIDAGTARISRYAPRRKIQLLPVEPVSQASANQRAGRCGRVAPGTCIRLFSQEDFESRPEFTDPEILRSNLAGVILQMKSLRLGEAEDFPFVEPPDPRSIRDGHDTLQELGAEDESCELTDLGRKLARLPVDPRIGRMILAADRENCLAEVLVIASALEIQDPRERPRDEQQKADAKHARFADERSDFVSILKLWDFYHDLKAKLSSSRLKKACIENYIHFVRMREWLEIHRQLRAMCMEIGLKPGRLTPAPPRIDAEEPKDRKKQLQTAHEKHDVIHRALLSGLLSSIGKRSEDGDYAAPRGGRFHIHPGSHLAKKKPDWLMAAELVRTTKLFARSVAKIDPAWIEDIGSHLVKRSHAEPFYNEQKQRIDAYERVSLLGLPVVERRPVHFGPIDPVTSREMFIHEALVEDRLPGSARFQEHNRELIAEIEALEAKARRRDLLADNAARFDFYDRLLPAGVYSSPTLARFRKIAEREQPELLFMSRQDLLLNDPGLDEAAYPDALPINEQTVLPLHYRHDPGATDDGVTLDVPLPALNQVSSEHAEAVVPGLAQPRLEALFRALPRSMRRHYDPARLAAELAEQLDLSRGLSPLWAELARHLTRVCGQAVTIQDLADAPVPEHLRLNIRVLDDQGVSLGESRDLDAIKKNLAPQASEALRKQSARSIERPGLVRWDFDDLPDRLEIPSAGVPLVAYPALEDPPGQAGSRTASIKLFDTPDAARLGHQRGLRRLFYLESKQEIRHAIRHAPGIDTIALAYAPFGDRNVLQDEIALRVAEMSFLHDEPDIRDSGSFDARLNTGWGSIADQTGRAIDLMARILAAHTPLERQLAKGHPSEWRALIADVRYQLDLLLPNGFLTAHPAGRTNHLPRYITAIRHRLERLAQGGLARDREGMALVMPRWLRYLEFVEDHPERALSDRKIVAYRWMMEELRVQVFDQRLGTAEPVSPKRVDELWSEIR